MARFVRNPLTGGVMHAASSAAASELSDPVLRHILSPVPIPSALPLAERVARCVAVTENGGECVQMEELQRLLECKSSPICYDGFEPSGRMHLAQGILKAVNVNRLTSAGGVFVFWVADWFALLNNKFGGDLEKIKKTGQYFIEVWKAVGMDMRNVRFLWASEMIEANSSEYWLRVMNVARANNIARIKRCCQIMGRSEGDDQTSAQILYPCMQAADVFFLHADICQLGLDQRKVNMLAREYMDAKECAEKDKLAREGRKPVILSHAMMPGLLEGQEKMSKSDPDSAIFMEDSEDDVRRKIKKAFCPPMVIEGNPCVAYVKMLVFPLHGCFTVERSEKNGGNLLFNSVAEFDTAYATGALHPADLKANLARLINAMIQPVRDHFQNDLFAKKLLDEIRSFKVSK